MQSNYNYNFVVNYHLVEQELLRNAIENNVNDEDYDDTSYKEHYSINDVKLICSELYKKDYLNAFGTDNYLDDTIDEKLRMIYNSFTIVNNAININYFKEFIDELFQYYLEKCCNGIEIKETKDINDVKYMCFLSLFSQDLFYITHQLICHFFKNNEININLINKLKQKHLKFDE